MRIESLGHMVIKVGDMTRAEAFYRDVLGMTLCARMEDPHMAFFTMGNHHDFAIASVGADAERASDKAAGLAHVAFKIGNSLDQLREAKDHLEAAGVKTRTTDHEVTQSVYFRDPDGNMLEVYVDTSDAWREDPQKVAQGTPLEL